MESQPLNYMIKRPYFKLKFILIVLLACISFGVYINSLQGGFLIDDHAGILENKNIHDLNSYLKNNFNFSPGAFVELVRAVIWNFFGSNTLPYHLFNVLAHVVTVILIFVLCNILFKNITLSFLTGLIFAVHPIHTEAVSWISGGPYVLSALFFTLSLIFYIKSEQSMFYLVLTVLAFVLSYLTGNSAVSLPLIFIVYELFFRDKTQDRGVFSRKIRIFVLAALLLTAIMVAAIFFLRRNTFIHTIFYFKGFSYLVVVTKAFLYYLKIIYLPLARGLYHPFAYNSVDTSKLSPAFFVSLSVLVFSIFLFFKCLKKNKPVSFSIALFFVTYLPYSNIIPVCNIISERYVYLPSLGVSLLIAALFLIAWEAINKDLSSKKVLRIIAMVLLVLFILSYSILTVKRNNEYKDIITYWKTNINNFPDGYMAYNNLAGTFYVMGQTEQALAYSWITLMIKADQPHVWCNLGKVYFEKKDMAMSEFCYKEALKLDKGYPPAIQGMKLIKEKELPKKD